MYLLAVILSDSVILMNDISKEFADTRLSVLTVKPVLYMVSL